MRILVGIRTSGTFMPILSPWHLFNDTITGVIIFLARGRDRANHPFLSIALKFTVSGKNIIRNYRGGCTRWPQLALSAKTGVKSGTDRYFLPNDHSRLDH